MFACAEQKLKNLHFNFNTCILCLVSIEKKPTQINQAGLAFINENLTSNTLYTIEKYNRQRNVEIDFNLQRNEPFKYELVGYTNVVP